MFNKIFSTLKPFLKPLLIFSLVFTLVFSSGGDALAARSGGRIGGGSFRSFRTPSRSYSAPSTRYNTGSRGYGYGGGFGFPFLIPFFGFGGGFGGIFSILIVIAIANFLVNAFRNATSGEGNSAVGSFNNPKVSVGRVQVGLMADARGLKKELDTLGRTADTGTPTGRAKVLQEATLAILRHPEYWVYGAAESQQSNLDSAEAKFNQLALNERSKFTKETLSNFNSQLNASSDADSGNTQESGEYIIITILAGAEGKFQLPTINDTDDMQQALRTIGSLGSDRLLAVEILWTPQADGDTLTTDDILAQYPDLKLV